ncbi:hypothetical protein DAPPUDRAFT_236012 [Daphnia pulex]|uniref:Uncharacterized protein n=1 Tax=Daphnia pulex TaxID=6669 RepID=E9FZP1_DAPPU|nr:hypothetical protein DAPPUDRAFT_236012 [Daphnia pulex]|eukprot:EFX87091.1 hypothetical protein DAPPUDRAFT_236012 [Daphnia pulex]
MPTYYKIQCSPDFSSEPAITVTVKLCTSSFNLHVISSSVSFTNRVNSHRRLFVQLLLEEIRR